MLEKESVFGNEMELELEDEIQKMLQEEMAQDGEELDIEGRRRHRGPCKFWSAEVFIYCTVADFRMALKKFLLYKSIAAKKYGFCLEIEDTVYLGCTCACGFNQIVVYYTLRPIH